MLFTFLTMHRVLPLIALALVACSGRIGDVPLKPIVPDTTEDPDPNAPAFTQKPTQVRLLPFSVRLAKVSAVAGVPTDDQAFTQALAKRYQLGDYDYANHVVPDAAWSASRMSLWVDVMQPVCNSAAMRERYPDIGHLAELYRAAYGRDPTDDELTAIADTTRGLDAANRQQTICLAVLASLEFVAQ